MSGTRLRPALVAACLLSGAVLGRLASRDARADAPAGHYVIGAETVRDTRTGLEWQRDVDGVERTWEDAKSWCARLPLAGGGWRLPHVLELSTLVDVSRFGPAIDHAAFPDAPGIFYWSATPAASDPGEAWGVFYYGDVVRNVRDGLSPARCVR